MRNTAQTSETRYLEVCDGGGAPWCVMRQTMPPPPEREWREPKKQIRMHGAHGQAARVIHPDVYSRARSFNSRPVDAVILLAFW